MEKKKIIFVVDLQHDFYSNNGSLYINGSENVADNIVKYINTNKKNIEKVICTVDWHMCCDKSFKVNGGMGEWPVHCVQFTEGAMLYPELAKCLIDNDINYNVFSKGDMPTHEEYGAFETKLTSHKNKATGNNTLILSNYAHTSATSIEVDYDKFDYYICGIAGDYCVYHTWQNLNKYGIITQPIDDCIAWISDKFEYEKTK